MGSSWIPNTPNFGDNKHNNPQDIVKGCASFFVVFFRLKTFCPNNQHPYRTKIYVLYIYTDLDIYTKLVMSIRSFFLKSAFLIFVTSYLEKPKTFINVKFVAFTRNFENLHYYNYHFTNATSYKKDSLRRIFRLVLSLYSLIPGILYAAFENRFSKF